MFRAAARYMIRSAVLLGLLAGLVAGGWLAVDRLIMKSAGPHSETTLVILSPGEGHSTIRWTLKRAGVIRELYHYDAARILAGKSFVPKKGEYQIPPAASIKEVMAILHAGRSYQRRFTIVEGMTVDKVLAQLAADENFSGDITMRPAEGSILPETYFYTRGTTRDAMLNRMQEKREMLLLDAWVGRDKDLPFKTREEALILASIVELETADSADRREVAGIFVNRLRRSIRLQSDPTVLYGVSGGERRAIRLSDLRRETEWTTYVIRGVPKTPICNPSQDSIDAVMHPAKTENLYFVSDGYGGLRFAEELDQHNKNVRLFRKFQRETGQRGS